MTTFAYDAAGEHLLSATDAAGTVAFTYVTGQGPQREHAVASVTYPDGTHTFFSYDARGRLFRTTADGGAASVTTVYDGFGGVTTIDAAGGTTVVRLNEFGDPGEVTDAVGNVTRFRYDVARNLVRAVGPDGSTVAVAPDARGNPATMTDPLGGRTDAGFDPVFGALQTVRDPHGYGLSYRTVLIRMALPESST